MRHLARTVVIAALGAALGAGLAWPGAAEAADADTVLARVGDTEITLGHVIAATERLPEEYRNLPDDILFTGILEQLVEQTAVAAGVSEPFSRRLGIEIENASRELVVNNVLTAEAEAAVTDEALEALYAERYLDAEPEREFNAAHILVETEEEAADLRAALDDGADFGALAREHSLDPGSGAGGGDLGWFGLGRMVAPFEAAVLELSPGEISQPVETQFGWHLVKLIDTRIADTPPLDEVRARLAGELQQGAVLDHIAAAREAVEIEILHEGVDPALLRDQSLLDD